MKIPRIYMCKDLIIAERERGSTSRHNVDVVYMLVYDDIGYSLPGRMTLGTVYLGG